MKQGAAARLATTLAVVVSLLFMQLALAGYVCPTVPGAGGNETVAAMDMVPGMPCAGMDAGSDQPANPPADQPVLCHQHCTNAAQSFEPLKLPTVSLPAVVQVLLVPLHVEPANRQAIALAASQEAQPPPSPVFLSTLRLRV